LQEHDGTAPSEPYKPTHREASAARTIKRWLQPGATTALIGNPPEQRRTKMPTSNIALVVLTTCMMIQSNAHAEGPTLIPGITEFAYVCQVLDPKPPINVRTLPSMKGSIIGTIPYGIWVAVLQENGSWIYEIPQWKNADGEQFEYQSGGLSRWLQRDKPPNPVGYTRSYLVDATPTIDTTFTDWSPWSATTLHHRQPAETSENQNDHK
jgi:hypothetical protein